MSIRIGEMNSEVLVDAEPGGQTASDTPAEAITMKDFLRQSVRDRARTAAEGFDD